LILETSFCDGEVDQSTLGLNLRRIMGVLQLGVQEEVEVRGKRKHLVSHLDIL
jgi:hypothetical protein